MNVGYFRGGNLGIELSKAFNISHLAVKDITIHIDANNLPMVEVIFYASHEDMQKAITTINEYKLVKKADEE